MFWDNDKQTKEELDSVCTYAKLLEYDIQTTSQIASNEFNNKNYMYYFFKKDTLYYKMRLDFDSDFNLFLIQVTESATKVYLTTYSRKNYRTLFNKFMKILQ